MRRGRVLVGEEIISWQVSGIEIEFTDLRSERRWASSEPRVAIAHAWAIPSSLLERKSAINVGKERKYARNWAFYSVA